MKYVELNCLTPGQEEELMGLMAELDGEVQARPEQFRVAAQAPDTHLFVALDDDESIVGCATLTVYQTLLGRKGVVEDVVVSGKVRGRHVGRALMETLIARARAEAPIDIQLTSRPHRVAANALYRSLGFELRETNAYKLQIFVP
ncbi:MAG: GNAT family N-acetyltransferase [Bacteroidales bacterium]|nr:GNAT family N-acetyltransferase [Bacteroidales bacterium]